MISFDLEDTPFLYGFLQLDNLVLGYCLICHSMNQFDDF